VRRRHAEPWVEEIHTECLKLRSALLPKSTLGEAVNYTLNMSAKLRRCFDHAVVELSNNVAENSIRPVALGRKNWLHVGSAQAGPKVAAILSVVESCRRLGVPVKDYLLALLPGLAHRKPSELAQLTPGEMESRSRLTWVGRTIRKEGLSMFCNYDVLCRLRTSPKDYLGDDTINAYGSHGPRR
jgi:transposase